jgi:DinB superfamily
MAALEKPFEKVRPKLVAARVELISQLAKFTPDELTIVPASGEWSALVIAHHTYIADGVTLEQMRRIQNEENPEVSASDEEAPRLTRESDPPASFEAVLAGMAARREEIFEFLSALAPEAWERPFRQPNWGQLKFYQLVNILPQHDQMHARQLAELKAAISPVQS